jgi:hypothetical protein
MEQRVNVHAMIGEPITTLQMDTIMRISENVGASFMGDDRFDAYQFINRHMEDSRRIEREKRLQDEAPVKKKKAKKKEPEPETCSRCSKTLGEFDGFHDLVTNKKICYECYQIRTKESDWLERTGQLDQFQFKLDTPEKETTKPVEKRGNRMLNNLKSIMGEFGKVTTDQFKLSFQGVAVRTEKPSVANAASYAVYDAANNRMIDVMDFVLDAQGMLFKLPVTLDQLRKGDIIIVKEKPLVVKSVNKEAHSIRALNPLSNNETTHKPAGNLFGFQFITKVTSMFELMQGGQQGMNPFMMLALVGDSKEDSKISELLPFLMMGGMQQGAGANPMAQMLPFMLMSGKDGGSNNMMEMMLMSQMFNQGGGFGFNQQQPAQAQQGFGSLFGQGFPMFGENAFHPNTPASPDNTDYTEPEDETPSAPNIIDLLKSNPEEVANFIKNNPDLFKSEE